MKENKKSMAVSRKTQIVIIAVLGIGILVNIAVYFFTAGVVHRFNYLDYRQYSSGTGTTSGLVEYTQRYLNIVDRETRKIGLDENGALITRENTPERSMWTWGVILVVRPTGVSENVLVNTSDDQVQVLNPYRTYTDVDYSDIYQSHTRTQVEILDVIYQTGGTDYKVGQTTDIREGYYIYDRRVPQLLKKQGKGEPYYVNTERWTPMEQGEVYIVYGRVAECGGELKKYNNVFGGLVLASPDGVFCLSDTAKKSGWQLSDSKTGIRLVVFEEYIRFPKVRTAGVRNNRNRITAANEKAEAWGNSPDASAFYMVR